MVVESPPGTRLRTVKGRDANVTGAVLIEAQAFSTPRAVLIDRAFHDVANSGIKISPAEEPCLWIKRNIGLIAQPQKPPHGQGIELPAKFLGRFFPKGQSRVITQAQVIEGNVRERE